MKKMYARLVIKLKLTKKDLAKMKTVLKERGTVKSTTKEGVKV